MSQVAMFSRTGSDAFPSFLKCMVTGPPKSGKTTLLGTVPNILVLDTEPHANNLQSIAHLDIPFKAIYSSDDLRQTQFILSQETFRKQAAAALGMQDIEAVAIDTLDTFQGILKRERMREQRSSQFLRDDWGWLKEEMTSILESYLALPMHVFFIVHTKTKDIGSEKNPQTIVLPGLEGAIAESIAGMVGYSLLSFRDEQIKPDGTKYTKYWLRAEGNDTYQYLGNRAAGRLPDVIEPDFDTLLKAALANRPTQQQAPVQVELTGIQTTGQIAQAPQPAALPPAQVAQNPGQAAPTPQQQAPVAQNPGQPQQAPANPALPADDEPVNAAALTHVKKVYDALGLGFPEDTIKALNLGQARDIVRMFKAAQSDEAAGNLPEGRTAQVETVEYLSAMGWMPSQEQAKDAPKQVEPKLGGTIEEAKAYVGDDLARANEAFEYERTNGNRKTLMEWLESKGASHGGSQASAAQEVQTDVQTPEATPEAPAEPETPVTPEPAAADATPTEEQAVAQVQEALGGQVISEGINPEAKCEACGNQIDDVDLAQLGKSRFGKVLCVGDYIAETKK